MTIIQLEDIAPESRSYFIDIGRDYGSERTSSQINRSLAGVGKHRAVLLKYGLTEAMETWGVNLRESLRAAVGTRDEVIVGKKVTRAAAIDAMHRGKEARRAAQTAFSNAIFFLRIGGNAETIREIEKVLHETRTAGADLGELERQLGLYLGLLDKPGVRPALGDAAASVEADLIANMAALKSARETKTGSRGTPAETQYIDLLDGLAVVWAREIRKIARTAASAEGVEAIATDLDLRALYKTSSRSKTSGGEGGGEEDADGGQQA